VVFWALTMELTNKNITATKRLLDMDVAYD
jgi:hypothetical protein